MDNGVRGTTNSAFRILAPWDMVDLQCLRGGGDGLEGKLLHLGGRHVIVEGNRADFLDCNTGHRKKVTTSDEERMTLGIIPGALVIYGITKEGERLRTDVRVGEFYDAIARLYNSMKKVSEYAWDIGEREFLIHPTVQGSDSFPSFHLSFVVIRIQGWIEEGSDLGVNQVLDVIKVDSECNICSIAG